MKRITLIGGTPAESYLGQAEGNLAEVLAFAVGEAQRKAAAEDGTSEHDCSPASSRPTVPALRAEAPTRRVPLGEATAEALDSELAG